MAKDNGYTGGAIPVDMKRLVESVAFEGSRPHMEYGTNEPRVKDGVTQWEVDCIFRPFDTDLHHKSEVVPVKVWAKARPEFKRGITVELVRPYIYVWNQSGYSGVSYFAEEIKPVAQ